MKQWPSPTSGTCRSKLSPVQEVYTSYHGSMQVQKELGKKEATGTAQASVFPQRRSHNMGPHCQTGRERQWDEKREGVVIMSTHCMPGIVPGIISLTFQIAP